MYSHNYIFFYLKYSLNQCLKTLSFLVIFVNLALKLLESINYMYVTQSYFILFEDIFEFYQDLPGKYFDFLYRKQNVKKIISCHKYLM